MVVRKIFIKQFTTNESGNCFPLVELTNTKATNFQLINFNVTLKCAYLNRNLGNPRIKCAFAQYDLFVPKGTNKSQMHCFAMHLLMQNASHFASRGRFASQNAYRVLLRKTLVDLLLRSKS